MVSVSQYNKAIDVFKHEVMTNSVLDQFFNDNHISLRLLHIWSIENFFIHKCFDDTDNQISDIILEPDEVAFMMHHPEYVPVVPEYIPPNDGSHKYVSVWFRGTFRGTRFYTK